jgi:hypothetical protein
MGTSDKRGVHSHLLEQVRGDEIAGVKKLHSAVCRGLYNKRRLNAPRRRDARGREDALLAQKRRQPSLVGDHLQSVEVVQRARRRIDTRVVACERIPECPEDVCMIDAVSGCGSVPARAFKRAPDLVQTRPSLREIKEGDRGRCGERTDDRNYPH